MADRSCGSIGGVARFVGRTMGILNKLLFIAISLSILSLTSVQSFQTINSISTTSRQQYNSHTCTAIKSTTSETSTTYSVTQQQSFILDGGELQSFLLTNNDSTSTTATSNSQQGVLSLVTGKTNNNERIIGVVKSSNDNFLPVPTISIGNIEVYKHTIAKIPQIISDKDALSTAAACLVGIHCSLPIVEDVGGSSDDSVFYGGKVRFCAYDVHFFAVHFLTDTCVIGSSTRWKRLRMFHCRWTINTWN